MKTKILTTSCMMALNLSLCSVSFAATAIPKDHGGPRFITWTNDYSHLKSEENRTEAWQEKLNYIPVGQDPDYYMSIGRYLIRILMRLCSKARID